MLDVGMTSLPFKHRISSLRCQTFVQTLTSACFQHREKLTETHIKRMLEIMLLIFDIARARARVCVYMILLFFALGEIHSTRKSPPIYNLMRSFQFFFGS